MREIYNQLTQRINLFLFVIAALALLAFIAIPSGNSAHARLLAELTVTPVGGGSGRIAFVVNSTDIYTVNVDGSDLQKVIGFNRDNLEFAHDPIWTADGKSIIYTGVHGLYIINIGQISPKDLTAISNGGPLGGRISKDGVLVFISPVLGAEDLFLMSVDGTHPTRLTYGGFHKDPIWLPDSETLLFAYKSSHIEDDPYQLCSINRRGRNFKCYTHLKQTNDGTDNDSHISPDYSSNRIVFVSQKPDSGGHQICVIPFEVGNTPHCLTSGNRDYDPAWSPDGNLIVFTSDRDEVDQLYLMNADGTNQHPIHLNSNEEFDSMSAPAWQPALK